MANDFLPVNYINYANNLEIKIVLLYLQNMYCDFILIFDYIFT